MLSFCRLCFSGLMFVLHWANSASSQVQNQRDTINGLYLCFCIVITLWLGSIWILSRQSQLLLSLKGFFLPIYNPIHRQGCISSPKRSLKAFIESLARLKPLNKEKNDHKLTNKVNNWYIWTRIKGAFFTKQNFNSWKKKNRNWK